MIRRWGYYRPKISGRREDIELILAGYRARIAWDPCFDKRGSGTRAILTASIDIGAYHYGIMFQHYREGFEFDDHTDGVPENKIITILLRKPKEGGEFSVAGPLKTWLFGRIWAFDGGRHHHSVSKITKGSRTVLMLQRGCWRINKEKSCA